jgi:hypothetical protein
MLLDFINDNEMSAIKKIDIRVSKLMQSDISITTTVSLDEFEDTKGVIRIRKLKKNRQHNSQTTDNTMAKRKRTNAKITIYKTHI